MQYLNNRNLKRPEEIYNQKLEKIAWGIFLIMIGAMALTPNHLFPAGSWLIGTGLILLGININRFIQRIETSPFTIFLGILALTSGINAYLNITFPVLPILIIIIGIMMVSRSRLKQIKFLDRIIK